MPTRSCIQILTNSARESNDIVGIWIKECVTTTNDPDIFTPNDELYASYKRFCERNGLRWPRTRASLTRTLKRKGYRAGEVKSIRGHSTRGCFGISVK